jgi:hypothetical protein
MKTGDVLACDAAGITATYTASSGVLALSGSVSQADWQAALRAVTYSSTSEDPTGAHSTSDREVTFVINDGDAASNSVTRTITVNPVPDAPVLANVETAINNYMENDPALPLSNFITVADADYIVDSVLETATVSITSGLRDGDVLAAHASVSSSLGISSAYDATTGELILTGTTTVANWQQAMRLITYSSTSHDPTGTKTTANREVRFAMGDGNVTSAPVFRTIRVTPQNDAPELQAVEGSSMQYTENDAATAVSATIVVSDPDYITDASLDNARVQIATGAEMGDELACSFTADGAITCVYELRRLYVNATNATDGTVYQTGETVLFGEMVLTGPATQAEWQTALRGITFSSTSEDPTGTQSAADRLIKFSMSDGDLDTNVAQRVITVTPVNDVPVLDDAESAAVLQYTENGGALVLSTTITVADADFRTDQFLDAANVSVSAGWLLGDSLGVNASAVPAAWGLRYWEAAPGVLHMSGNLSVAQWQAALRLVTYSSQSEDPVGARTLSFTISDGHSWSAPVTRTVAITVVNDASVLSSVEASPLSYTENGPLEAVTGTIAFADPDYITHAHLPSAEVRISAGLQEGDVLFSAGDAAGGLASAYNATTGVLVLTGDATQAVWQTALRAVQFSSSSEDPSAASHTIGNRTVTFTMYDSGLYSNTASRIVSVNPVNDVTVLANAASSMLTYTEDDAAIVVMPEVTVSDLDFRSDATLHSASIVISSNKLLYDQLAFGDTAATTASGAINGTYSWDTGTLSLDGPTATVAQWQAALRSVTYFTENSVARMPRTITFTVSDGDANSNSVSRSIDVIPINDRPVLDTLGDTAVAYTEMQTAPAVVSSTITVIDIDTVDDGSLDEARVVISGGFRPGDVLSVGSGFSKPSITFSANGSATGTLVLTATNTPSLAATRDWEACLQAVTFHSVSHDPTNATRVITFTISDGDLWSFPVHRSINVQPVNDRPVVSDVETATLGYTENGAAAQVSATLQLSDWDNTAALPYDTFTATVTVWTGREPSDRLGLNASALRASLALGAADALPVTAHAYDPNGGQLNLTGPAASLAVWQSALRAVTYSSVSEDPSAADRTIAFTLTDSAGAISTAAYRTISVGHVNDAPRLASVQSTNLIITSAETTQFLQPTLTVVDVDATRDANLEGAVVTIMSRAAAPWSSGFISATDTLSPTGVLAGGIVANWNATTGVLTLAGTATQRQYQDALRAVKFSTVIAGSSNRTVSIEVSDGQLSGDALVRNVSVTDLPVAPQLTSVQFDDTAELILASFNTFTERACPHYSNGLDVLCPALRARFDCSKFITVDGLAIGASSCYWTDAKTLVLVPTPTDTVLPESVVTLTYNRLRQQCEVAGCTGNPVNLAQTSAVSAPSMPPAMVTMIQAPTLVGLCDDVVLDASKSIGGARRVVQWAWAAARATASNESAPWMANVTALAAAASGSALTVPAALLRAGENFVFTVSATNFLGTASTAAAPVQKLAAALPTVSIAGESGLARAFLYSEPLSLLAVAQAPACVELASKGLQYSWSIDGTAVASTATDQRVLKVAPADTADLQAGGTYRIRVTITDSSQNSNFADTLVVIAASPLVATIAGGDRSEGSDNLITIDASASSDPDGGSVAFNWACVKAVGNLTSACGIPAATLSAGAPRLSLAPGTLLPAQYTFALLAVGSGARSASASVTLDVVSGSPPAVSIKSLVGKVSSNLGLSVDASIAATVPINATWQQTTGDLVWTDVDTFGTATAIETFGAAADTPLPLVINAHKLSAGTAYTFRLVASAMGDGGAPASFAQLSLVTNEPPAKGALSVTPPSGAVLDTQFELLASAWEDEDLPLSFKFAYVVGADATPLDATDEMLLVAAQPGERLSNVLLPAGGGEDRLVTIVVYVSDKYAAVTRVSTGATVTPLQLSVAELGSRSDALLASALDSGNPEGMFQVLGTVGAMMDSAPEATCETAAVCLATASRDAACVLGSGGSCGACVAGFVEPAPADAAAACVAAPAACSNGAKDGAETGEDCGGGCAPCATALACAVASDCASGRCASAVCAPALKQCPTDSAGAACAGHGTCSYTDTSTAGYVTAMEQELCLATNAACTPRCVCASGRYGDACSLTQAEQDAKVALRTSLLSGLSSATGKQDPSPDAQAQQSGFLSMLTESPGQLSGDSVGSALTMAGSIVGATGDGDVSPAASAAVMGTLGNLLDANAAAAGTGARRRLASGAAAANVTLTVLTLIELSKSQMSGKLIGQALETNGVGILMTTYRSAPAFRGAVVAPRTATETTQGVAVYSAQLESAAVLEGLGGGAFMDTQLVRFVSDPYAPATAGNGTDLQAPSSQPSSPRPVSNVVSMYVRSAAGGNVAVPSSSASLVVATVAPMDQTIINDASHAFICERGTDNVHTFVCPYGNISHTCDVSWHSPSQTVAYTITCQHAAQPVCQAWDGAAGAWSTAGCVTSAVTAAGATCTCVGAAGVSLRQATLVFKALAVAGVGTVDDRKWALNSGIFYAVGVLSTVVVLWAVYTFFAHRLDKKHRRKLHPDQHSVYDDEQSDADVAAAAAAASAAAGTRDHISDDIFSHRSICRRFLAALPHRHRYFNVIFAHDHHFTRLQRAVFVLCVVLGLLAGSARLMEWRRPYSDCAMHSSDLSAGRAAAGSSNTTGLGSPALCVQVSGWDERPSCAWDKPKQVCAPAPMPSLDDDGLVWLLYLSLITAAGMMVVDQLLIYPLSKASVTPGSTADQAPRLSVHADDDDTAAVPTAEVMSQRVDALLGNAVTKLAQREVPYYVSTRRRGLCFGKSELDRMRDAFAERLDTQQRLLEELTHFGESVAVARRSQALRPAARARLVEVARMRQLSGAQRFLYSLNKRDAAVAKPLHGALRLCIWLLAAGWLGGCGAYVVDFGMRRSTDVLLSWLWTALISLGFEMLGFIPLKVFVANALVPHFVAKAVRGMDTARLERVLDSAMELHVKIETAVVYNEADDPLYHSRAEAALPPQQTKVHPGGEWGGDGDGGAGGGGGGRSKEIYLMSAPVAAANHRAATQPALFGPPNGLMPKPDSGASSGAARSGIVPPVARWDMEGPEAFQAPPPAYGHGGSPAGVGRANPTQTPDGSYNAYAPPQRLTSPYSPARGALQQLPQITLEVPLPGGSPALSTEPANLQYYSPSRSQGSGYGGSGGMSGRPGAPPASSFFPVQNITDVDSAVTAHVPSLPRYEQFTEPANDDDYDPFMYSI